MNIMNNALECYTYMGGNRIDLVKLPDQFVVRALPEQLEKEGISYTQQVSSASSRICCRQGELESLMSQTRHIAPSFHDYRLAETGEEFLITDRIFVTFRESLDQAAIDAFAGSYGLRQKQAFSEQDYLFQLTVHTGMNPIKLVVLLTEEEPLVALAEHDLNYQVNPSQFEVPSDSDYLQQWHLHNRLSHPQVDPRSSSRCEEAWQFLEGYGSPDVVVGVTDDGCKLDHHDFDSPGKFEGWGYFEQQRLINNNDIDANPNKMYVSGSNHGTSCAGVIAAEINARLTVGAAPGCRLFPIKWESEGPALFISPSKLLTAINYLADKVDIISNSWGGVPTSIWPTYVIRRITELATVGGRRQRGIIFMWAAGNSNCPLSHRTNIDVPYTPGWGEQGWIGVQTSRTFQNNLVGVPGVVHVAALASNAQRSHYSNYGTGITFCGPSSNSHSYWRSQVPGLGITTATGGTRFNRQLTTDEFGGTSSATPLVAGIAALVISANPELTAIEVISLLKRTASKDLNFEPYPRTPPANFDPQPTWDVSPIAPFDRGDFVDTSDPDGTWSPWFGHGKVDALKAVMAALPSPGDEDEDEGEDTSLVLNYVSEPEIAIPDRDLNGIEDVITVKETGSIRNLRVSVDISHTWIGDLRVQLVNPQGLSVTLHNRAGASRNKIKQTYDPQNTPALQSFKGSSSQGDWKLKVQDLAPRDTGTLQGWKLEMDVVSDLMLLEDQNAVTIPDNNPQGIIRSLTLPGGRQIKDVIVAVDITHPFVSDLQVILIPPQGQAIDLHDRLVGNTDNLVHTWRSQNLPGLMALRGQDAGGIWQLKVADLSGGYVGKLNYWKIEVI